MAFDVVERDGEAFLQPENDAGGVIELGVGGWLEVERALEADGDVSVFVATVVVPEPPGEGSAEEDGVGGDPEVVLDGGAGFEVDAEAGGFGGRVGEGVMDGDAVDLVG